MLRKTFAIKKIKNEGGEGGRWRERKERGGGGNEEVIGSRECGVPQIIHNILNVTA